MVEHGLAPITDLLEGVQALVGGGGGWALLLTLDVL